MDIMKDGAAVLFLYYYFIRLRTGSSKQTTIRYAGARQFLSCR